ncbi:MAG: hypothetical protein J6A61_00560 [Clostridia bacterium]|nr:hypothetical protein [Clostridia bacterium]
MESNKKEESPKRQKKPMNWAVKITIITFLIAFFMGMFADVLSKNLSLFPALMVLIFIILVGIIADMAGIAIATADEKTLNAMAARKIGGAKEALLLLKNAEKATNIFNDVIGDIAGIVSGATGTTIGVYLVVLFQELLSRGNPQLGEFLLLSLLSAFVAALTVGGKAAGKKYAIKNAEKIVFLVGKIAYYFKNIGLVFHKKS